MLKILILLSTLTVAGCHKADDAKASSNPPKATIPSVSTITPIPTKAPESASPPAEPMYSSEIRQPLVSPHPLQEFRKYAGTIQGNHPITMELTFTDRGKGLHGHGRYRYDQEGIDKSVHANFNAANLFEFELYDTTGNYILETLKGRFTSLEAFEGVWTRYQPDSIQDPEYGTWKRMRILRERGSFQLARTTAGITPVRFEVFRKENDSTSRLKIKEGRVEAPYDSMPSNLDLAILRVQSGRDSIDSVINLGIDRAMKEFCMSHGGDSIPPETPISRFADSMFDRGWAYMRGEFFDDDFDTEVEANENGILSLRFSWSGYAGGPHPNDDHVYASIDVATGRKIGLKDILVPDYKDGLGSLAGEPSCDGDPEYTCNIERIVAKGFAILHNGIVFHANIGMEDRDIIIAHGDLAPLIKKGGILERFQGQGRGLP